MSKPLEIKVKLDLSQQKQQTREFTADTRKMVDAVKASQDDQKKITAASYAEQKSFAAEFHKTNAEAAKFAAKSIAETNKAAAKEYAENTRKTLEATKESWAEQKKIAIESSEAWARATRESSRATMQEIERNEKETHKRIGDESIQRARDSSKAIADAQRSAMKANLELESAATKTKLDHGQILKAAFDGMTSSEDQKQIASHQATITRMKAVTAESFTTFGFMKSAIGGAGQAVMGLVSQYATLDTAVQIVSALSGMWRAQRADIEAAADALKRQREEMLAIAALKDNPGRSTEETGAMLAFRAKTLQSSSAAVAFQEGSLNTGQASIASGFIDKDNFKTLMEYAGAYQATNPKVTPDAYGNLVGVLPSMIGQQNQSPEDVFRRSQGIMETFQKGSSNPGPAVSQFQKNGALLGNGLFTSPEQMASVQSAFSSVAPDEAATLTKQFLRGTTGGLTKMRGSAFEGSIPQSEYLLNELHATDQMNPVEIARKIAADIKVQQVKEQTAGRHLNVQTYLTSKGYQDEESRMAVMKFSELVNSGSYDRTFGPREDPSKAPTFDKAMKTAQVFQMTDPVAMGRKTAISGDIANLTKSMGPEEFYKELKKLAFDSASSGPHPKIYGKFEESNNSSLWEGQIIDEARRMILEQGAKVGLAPPEGDGEPWGPIASLRQKMGVGSSFGPLGGNQLLNGPIQGYSERSRAQNYYDYAQKIKERGGSATDLNGLIELMKKSVDLQQKAEDRAIKALPPIQPTGPPARQAGVPGRPI